MSMNDQALFQISPQIFQIFSGLKVAQITLRAGKGGETPAVIQDAIAIECQRIQKEFSGVELSSVPRIEAWRAGYKSFGVKPSVARSSIEALYKRVVRDGSLRSIHRFVDLYNLVSLKFMLPVGGEDLSIIVPPLELRLATCDEPPVVLLGDSEARPPTAGEVIYADSEACVCRCFNWREADRTKLTPETTDAVFFIEILREEDTADLEAAVRLLSALLREHTGGAVSYHIHTSKSSPSIAA